MGTRPRIYSSCVANTNMVSCSTKVSDQPLIFNSSNLQTPAESKIEANGNSLLQRCTSSTKVSADTTRILTAAWRKSTSTKYESTIKKFTEFWSQKQTPTMQADTSLILELLTSEFGRGLKYNTLRGSLTAIAKVTNLEQG